MKMTKEKFLELATQYDLIPLAKEIIADTETPISLFLKLKDSNPLYLLESARGGEKNARYSFLGLDSFCNFSSWNTSCIIRKGKSVAKTQSDPLVELKKLLNSYKTPSFASYPPFCGGATGFMSYEMAQFIENIGSFKENLLDIPDCCFVFPRIVLVYDHRRHTLTIVNNVLLNEHKNSVAAFDAGQIGLEAIARQIAEAKLFPAVTGWTAQQEFGENRKKTETTSSFSKAEFCAAVLKVKEHIRRGDIFQGVLSRRLTGYYSGDPFMAYRILRTVNPSPYMFYLNLPEVQMAGSSPEMLVRLEKGVVTTRPIAGTRPRGSSLIEERVLEEELINNPKERAEHLMLVDLGRNDLGRICRFGSVKVKEIFKVDKFSHVMHMVSEIEGILKEGLDSMDVFKAAFPAGTVTGAPKIKAMQIINELEPVRRGPYAGAVGYFSFSGNMDTCITIRTMIFKKNSVYIQSGAGIVADSEPLREYVETKEKAGALLAVLAILKEGEENGVVSSG